MKSIFTALYGLLFCCHCFSQFNDSVTHFIQYSSTGVINRTNEGSSYVLNNGLRFSISKKIISLNFNSGWIYGAQQSTLTNNDLSSSLDFNVYKGPPHSYFWGLATYSTSYSLKINQQLQAGLGVGYYVMDRKNAILILSDGILYETNNLAVKDTASDTYHTYRNSLRLKFRFVIRDIIVFDGMDFWQPSLSNGNDYIIKSNTSLSVKLNKWLSLTTSLSYNKFNRTNRENLLFTYGLTAEKYF